MHKDVIKVPSNQVIRPQGEIFVVYFSSLSNNTHRFVEKLQVPCQRIPYSGEEIVVDQNYVLFVPTYSGGDDSTLGAVPKQVIHFLNNPINRQKCAGVIASGNTNFGNSFAIAGPILSKKLNVPLLYQFELLGTHEDVNQVKAILTNFWLKGKKLNG